MSATIATKASDSQVGIVHMESSLMTTTDERERRRKARRLQREISRLGCHPISGPGFLKGVNATVRAIDLEGLGIGGRCLLHALVAAQALWNCNIAADLHIGSALCRVGPDPYRDVIAFCGPGNAGRGTQFHAWLEVGDDILDFSVGEWQRLDARTVAPAQWTATLPEYWCRPRAELVGAWRPVGVPDLGVAWYGPYSGDPHLMAERVRTVAVDVGPQIARAVAAVMVDVARQRGVALFCDTRAVRIRPIIEEGGG